MKRYWVEAWMDDWHQDGGARGVHSIHETLEEAFAVAKSVREDAKYYSYQYVGVSDAGHLFGMDSEWDIWEFKENGNIEKWERPENVVVGTWTGEMKCTF
jgi:hypothetical protein